MSNAHDPDQFTADLQKLGLNEGCTQCAQLARLAYFDQLTGLANRTTFNLRLEKALARARRQQSRFAVLFLDLDDFKLVNDSFGHDTGDLLLQRVGERLCRCVREYDTVARYGGDEFAILLEDLSEGPDPVVERITAEFDIPFWLMNRELVITASVGVAEYPEAAKTGAGLLRLADAAMYEIKGSRRVNGNGHGTMLKVGS